MYFFEPVRKHGAETDFDVNEISVLPRVELAYSFPGGEGCAYLVISSGCLFEFCLYEKDTEGTVELIMEFQSPHCIDSAEFCRLNLKRGRDTRCCRGDNRFCPW